MASVVFYPLILFICSLYAYAGNKYEKKLSNVYLLIFLIIFSFIFGVRVNFGTDQIVYQHMYEFQGADLLRCEPIFVKLNQILYKYGFSTAFYFSTLSFLEIFFIYLTLKKERINFFVGFFIFYIIYIFNYVNISRQAIAMNVCLCSIYYFSEKKYFKWLFFVLLAGGFHIGALSLLVMIPLLSKVSRIKIPDFVYYILFILAFLMFEKLYSIVLEGVLIPFNLLTNGRYKLLEKLLTYKIPLGSGLGIRLKILGYICMLPALLRESTINQKNKLYFMIFCLGIFGELLASLNMNLQRLFYFYSPIQIILLSKVLIKIKKDNLIEFRNFIFCVGIFILIFLFFSNAMKGINDTSYYKWCFDF